MKKLITVIATLAVVAVSCNKENNFDKNINGGGDSTPGLLTATFEQAKVSYAEDGDNLQPAWEVDDAIVGFDEVGDTYTFTVTKVQATTATLSADKAIADGKYYLIFKSGAQASDITDKSLAIDYTAQAGDKTMPAVMLAEGTVENGGCNFTFSNAGAIIGISALKGLPLGSVVSNIKVAGSNLSAATVGLDGSGNLVLTVTAKADDAISTATLSGITTTDANGTLSTPLYIAVPAGAVIKKVSASVSDKTYSYTLAAAKTAAAGEYLYVKTQEFKEEQSIPEGALPGEFSVSGTKKVHFSKGNLTYNVSTSTWAFYEHQYDCATGYDANLISLFTWGYDAVKSIVPNGTDYVGGHTTDGETFNKNEDWGYVFGGESSVWRTLSKDEWTYLFNNRTDAASKVGYATVGGVNGIIILPDNFTDPMKNNGNGAFVPKSSTGWDKNVYTSGDNWNAMESAGAVFLPAAGGRVGSNVSRVGDCGFYWSSTALDGYNAYYVSFASGSVGPGDGENRDLGFSVRLITESK